MHTKTAHQSSKTALLTVREKGTSAIKRKQEISEHAAASCRARDGQQATYLRSSERAPRPKHKAHPSCKSATSTVRLQRWALPLVVRSSSLVITGKAISLSYRQGFRTAFPKTSHSVPSSRGVSVCSSY